MGSESKVLIDGAGDETLTGALALRLTPRYPLTRKGTWLDLGEADEAIAAALSIELGRTAVHWVIHTVSELISIKAFSGGRPVRELGYASDAGWFANTGKALPFESRKTLQSWTRKRGRLAAGEAGYEVLDAFLGVVKDVPKGSRIVAVGANLEVLLPASLVADARAVAQRRALAAEDVIVLGWELGKGALFASEEARVRRGGIPTESARPGPPQLPPGFVTGFATAAGERRGALDLGRNDVPCALLFSSGSLLELREMAIVLDKARWFLLAKAYDLGRSELG